VDRGPMADRRGPATQGPAIDDQGDLDDPGVVQAPVALDRELDQGVGPIVEDPVEPGELPFGVAPIRLGDLEVLALDDRLHDGLLGAPGGQASPEGDAGSAPRRVGSTPFEYRPRGPSDARIPGLARPPDARVSARGRPSAPRRTGHPPP